MKRIFYLAASVLFITACSQGPKTSEDAKEVKEASEAAVMFTVDTQNSVLNWEGAKITETVHHGSVNLNEGSLSVTDGNLVAGSFTVDMASITDADLTEETGKLKLEGHLKSGDFFNVAEFPTAKFEITAVQALEGVEESTHTITGNLTIKDITNSISFPANVALSETAIEATAKFEINRNEWNVVWGGTKTEQGIKDFLQNNLIKDEIAFEINLKATK